MMTPNMKSFLTRASVAGHGKGILVDRVDARTAGSAVGKGYGVTFSAGPLKVFMLTDKGRDALADVRRGTE
jgi:hypothetical protein